MRNTILILAVALLAFGCGRAEEGASGIVGAQSGTYNGTTVACANDSMYMVQQARCVYPDVAATGSTPALCRIKSEFIWGMGMALLTPSQPCGLGAAPVGVPLKIHDKLTISSVTAKWGTAEFNSHELADLGWFGSIGYSTLDSASCGQISATGVNSSSQTQTNEGLAAGLLASDGREVFLVGAGVSRRVINNNGQLKLGFNVPASYQAQFCTKGSVRILVEHCEDVSGNTYACP